MSDDTVGWPYDVLGLDTNDPDTKTVKRAYARRLKTIDQAKDPAGFQELREAYEYALEVSKYDRTPPVHSIDSVSRESISHPNIETETSDNSPSTTISTPASENAPEPVEGAPLDDHSSANADETDLGLTEDDRSRWEALKDELRSLLEQPFDNARWAALTRDPLLDVFEYANEMEHSIFGGMFTRIETRDDGERILPPFVTPRWIELIDQRFGWTQDLPLFQRKFGWHGANVLPLLSQRAYYTTTQSIPVHAAEPKTRMSWVQRTVMLCAGYTLIRAFVLVVLP